MSKKLAIAMFGQKRLSREGGVEIVVKELCTRMAQNGCDVTCYNRAGHHVSGAEYDDAGKTEYEGIRQKSVPTIERRGARDIILFHRFHTGSVFSAIGSVSPALSSGFPNLILCCFCTTITPDDLSPRVSHPRDLILRSFSARKYRCFSVLPLTKSILIFPQPQLRRFRSLSNLSIPTFHQFQPVVISIILACFLLAYNTSLHYRCSFYG